MLIRWMLSLTTEERLAVLQGFVDSVAAMSEMQQSRATALRVAAASRGVADEDRS